MNETAVLKITSLQRCISRARSTHQHAGHAFASSFDQQDAAILNILRACEQAIDLANMAIRRQQLGIPSDSRESFAILEREGHLAHDLSLRLQAMVGFRNLAVHQYRDIDLQIVEQILSGGLDDLLNFAQIVRPLVL